MEHNCGKFDASYVRIEKGEFEWILFCGEAPELGIEFCPYCGVALDAELRSQITANWELLAQLTDRDDCAVDHHGYCQHGYFETDPKCPHARAKELLAARAAPVTA